MKMKINKKEKIILLVIIAIVTLAIGYALVFTPQRTKYEDVKKDLETVEAEKADIDNRLKVGEVIDDQIMEAYNASGELSNEFFPLMYTFEADRYFQSILQADNLSYEELSIAQAEIDDLEKYVFTPEYLDFPLLASSRINEATRAAVEEPAVLTGEALGSITVSVDVNGKLSDVISFLDKLQTADQKSIIVGSFSVAHEDEDEDEDEDAPVVPATPEAPAVPAEEQSEPVGGDDPLEAAVFYVGPENSEGNVNVEDIMYLTGDILSPETIVDAKFEFIIYFMEPIDEPRF
jgi:hypothetical protein